MREVFFGLVGRGEDYRPADSISGKWSDMNTKCTNFQAIYQRIKFGWKSGHNDEDIMEAALVEYQATLGNFPYLKVWKLLRNSAKWSDVRPNVSVASSRSANIRASKRSKTTESAEPDTPTSDARQQSPLTGEENPFFTGEEGAEELPRPTGRRGGARSSRPESSSGVVDLSQAFSEMNQRLQDIRDIGAQRIQENREVVQLMKDRQFERDFDFLLEASRPPNGKNVGDDS